VTGDSLSGYLGPELVNEVASAGAVRGFVDTHNGTGLTSPNFVDWSQVARQQVSADHPDAVVVMLGGNDFQNMVQSSGNVVSLGTAAWTQEYQRRIEICLRIWLQGGARRVYWLSLPPARNAAWSAAYAQINVAAQRAAADVSGARYVDIINLVTDHGRYADFVNTADGQPVLVREPDGLHLNPAGSALVAHALLPLLE